jgi:RNA polymerase sigma-70 factor (ECF subfamily)
MSASDFEEAPNAAVASFEAELAPLLHKALGIASAMLLDTAAAEDAVQEASLKAWRRRSNRQPGTDLRPWFFAILANQCREMLRGRWARVIRLDPDAAMLAARSGRIDASEDILDLRAALMRLSARDRMALALRYYLDLPFVEVALIAGCSVDAAKSRVRRGETALRAVLMSGAQPR